MLVLGAAPFLRSGCEDPDVLRSVAAAVAPHLCQGAMWVEGLSEACWVGGAILNMAPEGWHLYSHFIAGAPEGPAWLRVQGPG